MVTSGSRSTYLVLHQALVPGPAAHLHMGLIVAVDRQDTKNQCKALRTEQKRVVQSLVLVQIALAEPNLCRNNPEVKCGLKSIWWLRGLSLPSGVPVPISSRLRSRRAALGASLQEEPRPALTGGDASEKAAGLGKKHPKLLPSAHPPLALHGKELGWDSTVS